MATVPGRHGCLSVASAAERQLRTETQYAYHAGPGDTPAVSRSLALYGAKYRAVLWLADQLASQGLLKHDADRQMAIFCLVADELSYTVVAETGSPDNGGLYSVNIESRGALADFVKAEIRNEALERKEQEFSLRKELEPVLTASLKPGEELSRAYRYIRHQQWRKAVIYLDQLEKKYPNWGDLLFAKALGFEGMHEMRQAAQAYAEACERGNSRACGKAALPAD